jgi:hypothetical protein
MNIFTAECITCDEMIRTDIDTDRNQWVIEHAGLGGLHRVWINTEHYPDDIQLPEMIRRQEDPDPLVQQPLGIPKSKHRE